MKLNFFKISVFFILLCTVATFYFVKDYSKITGKISGITRYLNWEPREKYNLDHVKDKQNIIPIAIIGSGPAGLSASLYGARASIYSVVFQGKKPGGQLTETTYVENWPGTPRLLGNDLITLNRKQAEKFGALMVNDTVECVDFSSWPYKIKTEDGQNINALSVIIATGSSPKLLNIPGESKYWGYGVTTCAVCDAPLYKDKDVVVVGGGDSAIEEAVLLSSYAKNVTVLVRGQSMRAAPTMRDRLKPLKNINVLYNTNILEIIGDEKVVQKVKLKNSLDNTTTDLKIDGVFLAIGHTPNSELFKKFVSTDDHGYIALNSRRQETSLPGVFAAGDVTDPRYKQAGTSAGDGIKAALDAIAFLQENGFNDNFAKTIEAQYFDPHALNTKPLKTVDSTKDLDAAVKKSKLLILEIGATYCVACKSLTTAMESNAPKFEGKADFAYLDLDKSKELKERFDLKSIPVLLIFKDGKLLNKYNKTFTKLELFKLINQIIQE